jgi:hypothetical protein
MIKKGVAGIHATRRGQVGPVDVTPPSAPVLSTGAITSSSVTLTWTAATDDVGVTGYDVYLNNSYLMTTTNLTYIVSGLNASTQYQIYLKAKDAANNTTDSNVVNPTTSAAGSLPAIQGYGALATGHAGNAGSDTYTVTTTNASGAGSLLNGIRSNRRIIFSVAGTINQRHDIVNISNLTIDGTTAPYPGVVITTSGGDGMSVQGTSTNILIRGLTFINCSGDGLNVIENATNVAVSHCTAYGNGDGNIDFANDASLCTMQYCIIGNHNYAASHNDGGTLVTAHLVSIHHNLFFPISPNVGSAERFPLVHRNYGVAGTPDADIRNNVAYKFGRDNATGSGYGADIAYGAKANVVNNYYYTTSAVAANDAVVTDGTYGSTPAGQAYVAGNISGNAGVNPQSQNNHAEFPIPAQYQITTESVCTALANVLALAGITQRNAGARTPVEQTYINGVNNTPGC